ncbi:hypothetical protein MET9862_00293 [Methylobacterium symbioticum]|uniref:Uncharacterized protein n=2 Tax=Methylobacterium symbioticum TaxID=2584084 RepID=A0A509E640_9HYPH|nr:hypothetical protein MET9862_00293 [Methylobacterium symbioticum]
MHAALVRAAASGRVPPHVSAAMNPLVPLSILVCVPIAAIALVLGTDTGIETSLITATIKTFIILGVIAAAISFGASRLAERSRP